MILCFVFIISFCIHCSFNVDFLICICFIISARCTVLEDILSCSIVNDYKYASVSTNFKNMEILFPSTMYYCKFSLLQTCFSSQKENISSLQKKIFLCAIIGHYNNYFHTHIIFQLRCYDSHMLSFAFSLLSIVHICRFIKN